MTDNTKTSSFRERWGDTPGISFYMAFTPLFWGLMVWKEKKTIYYLYVGPFVFAMGIDTNDIFK